MRWRHPERGVVLPNDFIPFAEQHGLIARIDSFVLDEACRQLAEWTSREGWPSGFTMAVNVSGRRAVGPRVRRPRRRSNQPPRHRTGAALSRDNRDRDRRRVGRHPRDTVSPVEARRAPRPRRLRNRLLVACPPAAAEGRHLEDRPELRGPDQPESSRPRDRRCGDGDVPCLGMTVVGEGMETNQQLETLAGLDCDQGQGFSIRPPNAAGGDRHASGLNSSCLLRRRVPMSLSQRERRQWQRRTT